MSIPQIAAQQIARMRHLAHFGVRAPPIHAAVRNMSAYGRIVIGQSQAPGGLTGAALTQRYLDPQIDQRPMFQSLVNQTGPDGPNEPIPMPALNTRGRYRDLE
jgi:hypothetical protein